MTAEMFEFETRDDCACGHSLNDATETRSRTLRAGMVNFRRCTVCGSWIQSPQLTRASLARWYNSPEYYASSGGGYLDYARDEPQRLREAETRYRQTLATLLPKNATVLEVGCATASLVAVLRSYGHEAEGLDLSQAFADMARNLNGVEVRVGDFLDMDYPQASFDMIILMGTISNLQNLHIHLQKVRGLLRPGGTLYFNMPRADSLTARLYGRRFWMFTASVMQFMTLEGCRRALGRAGFRLQTVRKDRQQPSLAKMLGHGGLGRLYPLCRKLGVERAALPFSVPIPAVSCIVASPISSIKRVPGDG